MGNFAKGYSMKDRQFWVIVMSLGGASVFVFAAMYSVQPLLPFFTEQFQISVSYASLSMSMTTLSIIIGLMVLGFLSDRYGRLPFVRFSILLTIIPFLLMPLTDSFAVIIFLRFIQGFAIAGVPAAALAYISEEIHPQSMGLATALYISCNALGGTIGRLMMGYLTENKSWEIAFLCLAFFGSIIFILVWLTLPKSRNFTIHRRFIREDLYGFWLHLKNPYLLLLFGFGIILQLSFTGMWSFIPYYLVEPPFLLSLKMISFIFLAYGLGIIGSPIANALANKVGIAKIRTIGVLLLVGGILCTVSTSLALIVVGLCIACLGFFTTHSLTSATVSRTASHQKGLASSLYLVSYYIGVAAGSTLLSPIWLHFKWHGIVIITVLLPIIYLFFLNYTLHKKMP
ncbi:MFS transporter [Lysinibacillus macroides]|uniref:Inner membrane transport protein ynfM n=1 Tax=Lysinibacillus macroides TaxID=33935 RepID=A0A0M9DH72_9BACI|nr:MFS transporter [Lysinibacillus macroides]KOY81398.1 Inner membrane transport protein ynfM [Lysinibacillus macroides]QPR68428.1 MFS transporter [Lysinibacillus macroides]